MRRPYRTQRAAEAILAVALTAALTSGQKVPDIKVNAGPNGTILRSDAPAVAVLGQDVFVVWADRRDGQNRDIYFQRSIDGGQTWLSADRRIPTNAAGVSDAREPQIAVAGPAVYVVWRDNRNGADDIYFNASFDGGNTWFRVDRRLDTDTAGSASSFMPRIAAAGALVCVAWVDTRNPVDWDIRFNRSLNAGFTWSAQDRGVGLVAGNALSPAMVAVGGSIYVTWVELVQGGNDFIAFNRSPDGGSTWTGTFNLSAGNPALALVSAPCLAAAGSVVHVAWAGQSLVGDPDVHYSRSADGGLVWLSRPVRLDRAPAGARAAAVCMAVSSRNVFVAWEDERDRFGDVFCNYSNDDGMTWQPVDVRLDTDLPGASVSTAVRLAASGQSAFAVWQDLRSGGRDLHYNRTLDAGATWLAADRRIDTGDPAGSSDANSPLIAVDSAGAAVYVVWQDERAGGDVYFNLALGSQPFGVGTQGTEGLVPKLGVSGAATIGGVPTLEITGGLGGAAGVWLVGTAGAKTALPALGGTIHVRPSLALPLPLALGGSVGVPGAGTLSLPLALPADPALVGAVLYFQAFVFDPAGAFNVSITNAIELWLG